MITDATMHRRIRNALRATRRATLLTTLAGAATLVSMSAARTQQSGANSASAADLAAIDLAAAGRVAGLGFSEKEIELMLPSVRGALRNFEALRGRKLGNELYPAFTFTPFLPGIEERRVDYGKRVRMPPERNREELVTDELNFADIKTLASRTYHKQISCVALTKHFLARLRALDGELHFVISYCEKRALETAKRLDAELARGKWRGPLHGIPYGAKDLLAARGAKTTWGAKPFEDQVLDFDASIVTKLESAGAVLVAKTSVGALAWGDVWFGGKTRTPWNPRKGSSGSSAGSASAVAAGALPFAIGTETLGSIISPSVHCGCSSLRPTFGRVARTGAMTLSWTMDKLGPICRSAEDAGVVFAAIHGADGADPTARDVPFAMPDKLESPRDIRIGVLKGRWTKSEDGKRFLAELEARGFTLSEVSLPRFPLSPMTMSLQVEGAAAFDELTRSGRDDLLVRQIRNAWPNVFRAARLVPAVEYLQANRLRVELMRAYDEAFRNFDVLVHPPYAGGVLGATNLTGHPTFVAPYAAPPKPNARIAAPASICFTGQLYDDARLLAVARAWQQSSAYHRAHPKR